jgi:hypothetical protein
MGFRKEKPSRGGEEDLVEKQPEAEDIGPFVYRRDKKLTPSQETLDTVYKLAGLFCTQREAAGFLGVCYKTFTNFLYECKEARAAWDDGVEVGKSSLRRKQFRLAEKSASMAIFLGKNYLGQSDDAYLRISHENKPVTEMTEEELLKAAQSAVMDRETDKTLN